MTDLDLSPPSRGQRVTSPRCGLGTRLTAEEPARVRGGTLPDGGGGVERYRTLFFIVQAELSGVCLLIDSIETSTGNLIYYRGHRDDQSDYRFGPDRCRPWPWFHDLRAVPEQGSALCPGPVEVPPGSLEGLPPGVPLGSRQGTCRPPRAPSKCGPMIHSGPSRRPSARPAVLSTVSRRRGPSQRRPASFVTKGGAPPTGSAAAFVARERVGPFSRVMAGGV